MAPPELRALAARVVAREVTNEEIALALGWQREPTATHFWQCPTTAEWQLGCPAFLTSLDAADLPWRDLRERGWMLAVWHEGPDCWCADAGVPWDANAKALIAMAPTEPQARVALALLCLAVEGER